ncbi:RAMP superfamily CRISPR-associated protein [Rhizohabitans arisaemae]|uniref:RAMP superfamily CRISPR-associated protein n=1 Tax=Rhizohabitans arisaemae TaxID=2720610 RepID=UPI0024B16C81|nr:RAMP superfamily CRISPR-associated protein [Rhizohabitans arisaemae]
MKVTLLRVDLELTSPGGVAAPETAATEHPQLPIARDPYGRPHIPATSIAGSLRAHAGQAAVELFGTVGEKTLASPVRLIGTAVQDQVVSRARTAVDRHRAAPARNSLRRSQHLAPGTRITVYLRLDEDRLLPELLDLLARWRPGIGGGRSVGFGRARVTGVRGRTVDLGTPDGLRAWLGEGGPGMYGDTATEPIALPETAPETPEVLRSHWEIVDGLHIGGGTRDEDTKRALLVRSGGLPMVPGSTWKGILRSRCEFILGSLDQRVCRSSLVRGAQGEEEAICGSCLICDAFGWAGGNGSGARSRLIFTDSPIEAATVVTRQHVALDRFTGGAAGGLLYAEEVVESGRLTLEIHLDGEVSPVIRGLINLALADIHSGLTGIGGATTRGLGTLRRTDLTPEQAEGERTSATWALLHHVTGDAA